MHSTRANRHAWITCSGASLPHFDSRKNVVLPSNDVHPISMDGPLHHYNRPTALVSPVGAAREFPASLSPNRRTWRLPSAPEAPVGESPPSITISTHCAEHFVGIDALTRNTLLATGTDAKLPPSSAHVSRTDTAGPSDWPSNMEPESSYVPGDRRIS